MKPASAFKNRFMFFEARSKIGEPKSTYRSESTLLEFVQEKSIEEDERSNVKRLPKQKEIRVNI